MSEWVSKWVSEWVSQSVCLSACLAIRQSVNETVSPKFGKNQGTNELGNRASLMKQWMHPREFPWSLTDRIWKRKHYFICSISVNVPMDYSQVHESCTTAGNWVLYPFVVTRTLTGVTSIGTTIECSTPRTVCTTLYLWNQMGIFRAGLNWFVISVNI